MITMYNLCGGKNFAWLFATFGGNDKIGFKNVRKIALFFILLNFCLLSVDFLHAVALSRMTIKWWSQVTIAISKCVGLQHSETKLPSIEEGTLNNAENSSRNLSEKNSLCRLTYLSLCIIQNPQELSVLQTGVHRIAIRWKIRLSWALTTYADFCGIHTNKQENRNRDTDLGQEREEGDRWLDGLTLRSFQTSKLKTLCGWQINTDATW